MVLSAKLRNRKLATPCTNYGTVGENMESGVLFVAYVDVTSFVHSGKNQLHVTVTGNLYNYLVGGRQNEPDLCFKIPVPYEPKDYGIYETKEKKCGVLVVKQEKHF